MRRWKMDMGLGVLSQGGGRMMLSSRVETVRHSQSLERRAQTWNKKNELISVLRLSSAVLSEMSEKKSILSEMKLFCFYFRCSC